MVLLISEIHEQTLGGVPNCSKRNCTEEKCIDDEGEPEFKTRREKREILIDEE
jgi:hypothetical protein